jgi:O-antigen/teichoic acid export membrane protein
VTTETGRATPGVAQPGRLRRAAPAGWALATRVTGLVATALSLVILSRRLGVTDFGVFAVATSVAAAGSLVTAAGVNRVLLRDVAGALARDERREARELLWAGSRAVVMAAPIGVLTAFVAGNLAIESGTFTVAMSAALALVLGLLLVATDVLRPLGEYRVANLTSGRSGGTLVTVLFLGLIAWSFTRPQDVDGALVLNLVAALVAAGLVVWVLVVRGRARTESAGASSWSSARLLLIAGLPFGVTQIALFLSSQVDLWVAGGVLPDTDTSLYAVSSRFTNMVLVPLNAAQLTLAAIIPTLFTLRRMEQLQFRVRRAATLATLAALGALLPCVIVPARVIGLLFGPEYEAGAPILVALALGQMVNVATGLCGVTLSLCGHERLVLVVAIVSGVGSAAADYIAARLWGVNALAIASAATTAGSVLVLWALARRFLGIWTHPLWPTPRALLGTVSEQ